MIQRVQSIWLLLTSLTLFLLLLLPIVTVQDRGAEYTMMITGLFQKMNGVSIKTATYLPIFAITILVALMAMINIFNFKNRTLQKRIAMVIILLITGLSFWINYAAQQIPGNLTGGSFNIGAFLPILAILWCFLAIRGIRKDEQLVRSADRLR